MGTPHTFYKSVWKDRGGGRGYGAVKERVNTFKCASKVNPAVNTIASWLNQKKNHQTSTSNLRPDAAVRAGVGKNNITNLPENLGNGNRAGTESKT